MDWAPLDPSRPLRPLPVLWLLAPWAGALYWLGAALADAQSPVAGPAGHLGELALALAAAAALGPIGLLLALTWVWLAVAVPGRRRASLWLAAALLAAPWLLPEAPAAAAARVLPALPLAAAVAAAHAVIVAALQGRAARLAARETAA